MNKEVTKKKARISKDSVITMLCDEKGNMYGPDNNPKREGTKSHERFNLYKHGMTVGEAREAGLLAGDFTNDVDKGYIAIDVIYSEAAA